MRSRSARKAICHLRTVRQSRPAPIYWKGSRFLEDQIQRRSVIVPIQDLAVRVEVIQPILAVVQEEDGGFVASFFNANINASGETQLKP